MGRHALPIFCAGSLMSALGQILTDSSYASPALDVLYVMAALALLHRLAGLIDRRAPALAVVSAPLGPKSRSEA
jgi:hypothetical protein